MGPVMGAMADLGVRVTGSDANAYGEIREWLGARGIGVFEGFRPEHLEPAPDLVVVGRAFVRGNPEVEAVLDRRLPYVSVAEFLSRWFLQRSRNLVVAGSKGKTTTTAMAAWILEATGRNPSYLIGGMPRGMGSPARFTNPGAVVIEGDDFSSLWWDDNPKFCYYRPELAIVTNLYGDHPEMRHSDERTLHDFGCLVNQIPRNGQLIIGDLARSPLLARLAERSPCPVRTVEFGGAGPDAVTEFAEGPGGIRFRWRGASFELGLMGRMNARNAVCAAMGVSHFGVSPAESAEALHSFSGVVGRLDPLLAAGEIDLYYDHGYLPECMEDLLGALRARHPGRRLVFLWQPFLVDLLPDGVEGLRRAMAGSDLVLFGEAYVARFSAIAHTPPEVIDGLIRHLGGLGIEAHRVGAIDRLGETVPPLLRDGDVVLAMIHPRQRRGLSSLVRALEHPPS